MLKIIEQSIIFDSFDECAVSFFKGALRVTVGRCALILSSPESREKAYRAIFNFLSREQ